MCVYELLYTHIGQHIRWKTLIRAPARKLVLVRKEPASRLLKVQSRTSFRGCPGESEQNTGNMHLAAVTVASTGRIDTQDSSATATAVAADIIDAILDSAVTNSAKAAAAVIESLLDAAIAGGTHPRQAVLEEHIVPAVAKAAAEFGGAIATSNAAVAP